jgi:hypothetical protein
MVSTIRNCCSPKEMARTSFIKVHNGQWLMWVLCHLCAALRHQWLFCLDILWSIKCYPNLQIPSSEPLAAPNDSILQDWVLKRILSSFSSYEPYGSKLFPHWCHSGQLKLNIWQVHLCPQHPAMWDTVTCLASQCFAFLSWLFCSLITA